MQIAHDKQASASGMQIQGRHVVSRVRMSYTKNPSLSILLFLGFVRIGISCGVLPMYTRSNNHAMHPPGSSSNSVTHRFTTPCWCHSARGSGAATDLDLIPTTIQNRKWALENVKALRFL